MTLTGEPSGRIRPPLAVRKVGPVVLKVERDDHYRADVRVFAPGALFGEVRVMLRGRQGTIDDLADGMKVLRRRVWSKRAESRPWRGALMRHLREVYPSKNLVERVFALGAANPGVEIHGDATAANLLRFPWGVRWVDPMRRKYIPGDPFVDVGKMMQSLWGYEDACAGARNVYFRHRTAAAVLAPFVESEVERATTWMLVHFARLLRYHDARVAGLFRELLEDGYDCRL